MSSDIVGPTGRPGNTLHPIANPGRTSDSPTLLLVDDDADIHVLVSVMLQSLGGTIHYAATAAAGLEMAERLQPDLILLDVDLVESTGVELLKTMRETPTLADIPVVFVTGNDSNEVLTACFDAGAADYVRKPFRSAELRARVRSVLENRRLVVQLQRVASHDSLTGLPNRSQLIDRLQQAMARSTRNPNYHFALLFIDFDRFKVVNDSLGHEVGDMLLREIAVRLRRTLRASDTVIRDCDFSLAARLGGDEFVVLLDEVRNERDAYDVADRLLSVLKEPYRLGAVEIVSTASIGIVTSHPSYTNPEEMIRDADTAMYEAKAAGKGRHMLFQSAMRTVAEDRLVLENDLRHAISRGELYLVYQPIVSLADGSLESAEALVRWNHPTRGLTSPDQFIPLAEETGLIVAIGHWVLEEALRTFAGWLEAGRGPRSISVNLSRRQLSHPNLVNDVDELLRRYEISPDRLHLELTENQIMFDPTTSLHALARLRDLGVQLDMDDFGTGHSSLACLLQFPIHILKIDRSFVASMCSGRDAMALVEAVTRLAQNLQIRVIAEGIETIEQLDILKDLGCTFGQGYLLSRPVDASRVLDYRLPDECGTVLKCREPESPAY
ncbi:MAG: EAL domain-containing protein [Myxococcales bacterium]|nr:EAL domain-containing protein [Myxococcales bacterium]